MQSYCKVEMWKLLAWFIIKTRLQNWWLLLQWRCVKWWPEGTA